MTHISTPESLAHRIAGRMDTLRSAASEISPVLDSAGVRHVIPRTVLPAGLPPRLLGLGRRQRFDVAFIDQPLLWSASLKHVARVIVYRPTDQYPSGLKALLQAQILREADAVVATSTPVLSSLGRVRVPALVLENGVDVDHFRDRNLTRSKQAVYVGAIDKRFDHGLVYALADSKPDWQFLVAGGYFSPEGRQNIENAPSIPYRELPEVLGRARIGLLPLSSDTLNEGRSPMKLYEYLASGLRVVSRQTPAIKPNEECGLFTYRNATEAVQSFDRATIAEDANFAGSLIAQDYSWRDRSTRLVDFVRDLGVR
ncbi:hypothetical protein ACIQLK_00245 [Microbacterium sp. NPDC091382]|uniref:glycosyltransferase family protein n=1 Tax=Microbacterium sp. NPDC091382 TaxID=3364210 RepID=UPI00382601D2